MLLDLVLIQGRERTERALFRFGRLVVLDVMNFDLGLVGRGIPANAALISLNPVRMCLQVLRELAMILQFVNESYDSGSNGSTNI